AFFYQQGQEQVRIPPIMFLLSWFGRSNLRGMTHQTFDSEFFHEVHKPLHRSRGFDSHSHRPWKSRIKLPYDVSFVLQTALHDLACGGVQDRQCLLASVQITSYNFHLGLLRSELCRANTAQSTRAVARPASLRHQSEPTGSCMSLPATSIPALNFTPDRNTVWASDDLPRLYVSCNHPQHRMRLQSRNGLAAVSRRIADTQFPAQMFPLKL